MKNKTICALFLLLAVASAHTFENMEFLDDDSVIVNEDIEFPSVHGTVNATVDCMSSVAKIIPALNTLIKDVKDADARDILIMLHLKTMRDVQTFIDDLRVILGEINSICDSCNIPKPTIPWYISIIPPYPRGCYMNAKDLAEFAEKYLITNLSNPSKIAKSLSQFVGRIPAGLTSCGIKI